MRSIIRTIAPVLVGAFVCLATLGCNVVRVSLNTTLGPEDVAFIVPGRTTMAEVVAKLGTPDSIGDTDTGMVATYRFFDVKYSRVNFGWLAKPWTPVDPDLIFSRTGLGIDAFQVFCNAQWVVVQQGFQRHLTRPPFYPYPFQQSRLSPQNALPPVPSPAIMTSHEPGNRRSLSAPSE